MHLLLLYPYQAGTEYVILFRRPAPRAKMEREIVDRESVEDNEYHEVGL